MDIDDEDIVVDDVISSIDETLASNRKILSGHRSKIVTLLGEYESLRREERNQKRNERNDYLMRQNITRDLSAISSLELAKFLQKGYLSEKTKELMSETLNQRDLEDRRSNPCVFFYWISHSHLTNSLNVILEPQEDGSRTLSFQR